MKTRFTRLLIMLVLLASLFPVTVAFADDDDGNYEFKGIVVSFPAGWVGDWLVNDGFADRVVHVTNSTRIKQEHGPIAEGVCVEVKGWLQADNSVNATKIETKEPGKCPGAGGGSGYVEFRGLIESLPNTTGWIGDWTVSNRTVRVSATTRIEQHHGLIAVGACVEVKGWLQADGSVDAIKVETEEAWKCPSGSSGGGGGHMEFYGTIESLPNTPGWIGDWVVSGRTVRVDDTTRIEQEHGPVAVGAYVEVKGWLQADGSVNATKIEVKMPAGGGGGGSSYTKFYGTVESLPDTPGWIGDWVVGGRIVRVTNWTRIEQEHGPVAVGAYVEVKGWARADGSVDATKIEVKSSPGGPGSGGYTKFYGTIQQMPASGFIGTWIVSGRTVNVSNATRIEQEHGPAIVGAYVEVKGYLRADGSVDATKIEVKSSPGAPGGGGYTKFYGTVEQMPADGFIGTWIISGRVTTVTATTRIEQEHGPAVVGAYVEVEGYLQADGSVSATKIEVKSSPGSGGGGGNVGYVKFYGVVEDLPATGFIGDWVVSGRTVRVDASTRIEQEHGTVRIGAFVEVKGIQQADGSVNATKIEVKN